MFIIGFGGKAEVGKTTCANYLVKEYRFTKLSFADPLKECLSVLTGLPIEHFQDKELKNFVLKRWGLTVRELMQKFATDFIRDIVHPDFWVHRMDDRLKEIDNDYIVIDDIRFQNEINFVNSLTGITVNLKRQSKTIEGGGKEHKSEHQPLFFDKKLHLPNGILYANNELDKFIHELSL